MFRRELLGEVSKNGLALYGERGTLNIEPLVRVDPGVNVIPNTFIELVPRQAAISFFACNLIRQSVSYAQMYWSRWF